MATHILWLVAYIKNLAVKSVNKTRGNIPRARIHSDFTINTQKKTN